MFVQEVALVDCPFDDVARRLEADPIALLAPPPRDGLLSEEATRVAERIAGTAEEPTDAHADGSAGRRRVGPGAWPAALARTVTVQVGPVRRRDAALLVALSWSPDTDRTSGLLPSLEADLEVVPVGTSETALTLRGRYEPPAGAFGRRVDALVLHRLAEATVRAFLEDVRDRLDPTLRRSPARRRDS